MAITNYKEDRRTINDITDLVWLGGFLDARGSLVTKKIPRFIIRVEEREIAERIARITGGALKGPHRDKKARSGELGQSYYLVTLYNFHSVRAFFERIKPYISQARYDEVTSALAAYDPPNARRIEFDRENCGYYDTVQASASGYVRHKRRGEEACRMCTECERLYYRQRKTRSAEA